MSFFDDEKYYQAINYLLEALDAIYRVIKNIPDRELQIGYIKSRKGGDSIKDKLAETIYKIFGKENTLHLYRRFRILKTILKHI